MMNSSNIIMPFLEKCHSFMKGIIRFLTELLSNLVYGRRESSGLPARFSFVHPIDEPHVGEHVGQMSEAA